MNGAALFVTLAARHFHKGSNVFCNSQSNFSGWQAKTENKNMDKELIPLTPKDFKNMAGINGDINRNIISLGIFGFNEDPIYISKLLDLQPKSYGKKGEEYFIGKNKDIRKINDENYWKYEWVEESNNFIGDFVEKFIDEIILRRIDKFKELNQKCEIQLQIVQYYSTGSNPGIHIDKKKMRVLSEIGTSIDIDIYCLSREG